MSDSFQDEVLLTLVCLKFNGSAKETLCRSVFSGKRQGCEFFTDFMGAKSQSQEWSQG